MMLDSLKTGNVQMNPHKCKLGVPEISFLVNKLESAGIVMTVDKVLAIIQTP